MSDVDLSDMIYQRRRLHVTLQQVMVRLYEQWDRLPSETQETVERLRQQLATDLDNVSNAPGAAMRRGDLIEQFLLALEELPAVRQIADHELRAGKTTIVVRSGSGPSQQNTAVLLDLLQADPAGFGRAAEAAPPSKGINFAPPPPALREEEAAEVAPVEPVQPEEESEAVQFHTKVDFPQQIRPQDEKPLIVQLTLERPAETRVDETVGIRFAKPQLPEMVEIFVTAPGFSERTGVWSRTIAVYSNQDSQPAIFLLKPEDLQPGSRRITIDFRHQGRSVGSFAFETRVDPIARGDGTGVQPLRDFGINLPQGTPPPPVDVELRIVKGNQDNTLHFTLHSTRAQVGYHWKPVGSVTINNLADPLTFLNHHFERLNQLAAKPVDSLDEDDALVFVDDIQAIGEGLYEDLFPDDLKDEYWRLKELRDKGEIHSLLITSDEPWIPWELVKPYEEQNGEIREGDFLAGDFELSRWLAGRGPMDQLEIRAARIIAPNLDLAFVAEEREYFDELSQKQIDVGMPLQSRTDVLKIARAGGIQLLHFAAHGTFNAASVNESAIVLQNNEELIPDDLVGRRVSGLRRDRPVVFLNICHGARLAFDLTGLGGWAEKMVDDVGVTAFIGSHWEVNDLLASQFAETFYNNLWAGQSLGQAFHNARSAIRERQPANPTWLAYTLYGDPNSRVTWARVAVHENGENGEP